MIREHTAYNENEFHKNGTIFKLNLDENFKRRKKKIVFKNDTSIKAKHYTPSLSRGKSVEKKVPHNLKVLTKSTTKPEQKISIKLGQSKERKFLQHPAANVIDIGDVKRRRDATILKQKCYFDRYRRGHMTHRM